MICRLRRRAGMPTKRIRVSESVHVNRTSKQRASNNEDGFAELGDERPT